MRVSTSTPARPTVPMETGVSVSDDRPDWLFWGGVSAATLTAIIVPILLWPDGEDGIPTRLERAPF